MANFIHPTAIIGDNVILGDNNYIGAYCIIGDPAEHKKFWEVEEYGTITFEKTDYRTLKKLTKKRIKCGNVIIGDNNIITGLVTIDAGTKDITTIGNNCFIMKHAHIGHDCILLDNVTISCGAKIGGHSIVKEYSNIGLNAVLHQFTTIERGCMVGASAFIKGETEEFTKYAGVPARKIGINEYSRNIINPK
jgi:UDP-N-acetylglucosamine acyltransferase